MAGGPYVAYINLLISYVNVWYCTGFFLAARCLKKLREKEVELFPNACKSINRDFYMNDYFDGAKSIKQTIQLSNALICVMKKVGMSLRKWLSNEPCIIKDLSEKESSKEFNYKTKILGLH